MNLLSIVEHCKTQIEESPVHHLEREYRNEFFSAIGDIDVSLRLLLNVAIKTSDIFNREYPDDHKVQELIEFTQLALISNPPKDIFKAKVQQLHTHLNNLLDDEKFDAIYAGLAVTFCAYEVIKHQVINDDTDEFDDEPDEWSSCFFASLASNGGAADTDDIDAEKNKQFWYWFLDDALAMAQQGNPVLVKH